VVRITKGIWDREFKKSGKIFVKPEKDVVEIAKFFEQQKIKKILDLGCGSGRHLVCLARMGFRVYGIDIAKEGIKIAKNWLKEESLTADLKVGDIYKKLPYPNNFFDAVIGIRVIHHGKIEWIRKCIKELARIIKPNGWLFVTIAKKRPKKLIERDKLYGIKWIAPRTYIILGGPEKGLPHYEFNKKILLKEFGKHFKIIDFQIDSKNFYYKLLAQRGKQ
jgi:ubiquinone/menaquinone biosynthesis C-methylase UbiE